MTVHINQQNKHKIITGHQFELCCKLVLLYLPWMWYKIITNKKMYISKNICMTIDLIIKIQEWWIYFYIYMNHCTQISVISSKRNCKGQNRRKWVFKINSLIPSWISWESCSIFGTENLLGYVHKHVFLLFVV